MDQLQRPQPTQGVVEAATVRLVSGLDRHFLFGQRIGIYLPAGQKQGAGGGANRLRRHRRGIQQLSRRPTVAWAYQGDGDSLRITETGIRELGPWEPLPMGSALVDYWRGRLGKAERLILEMLTQGQGS